MYIQWFSHAYDQAEVNNILCMGSAVRRLLLSEDSLDLAPSVLAHPSVSTSLVSVDGNRLGGSITMAGRAHPVILILHDNDG